MSVFARDTAGRDGSVAFLSGLQADRQERGLLSRVGFSRQQRCDMHRVLSHLAASDNSTVASCRVTERYRPPIARFRSAKTRCARPSSVPHLTVLRKSFCQLSSDA